LPGLSSKDRCLGLLSDQDEDPISHARLPHSEAGWDPSRGNLRFEKIVATLH
jgi:hypothetical protein